MEKTRREVVTTSEGNVALGCMLITFAIVGWLLAIGIGLAWMLS
jgi:hypothetical protein